MAIEARQSLQQRLMLAPNVTLALEILRMPTLELQMFLRHQLEENPLLELEDGTSDEQEPSPDQPETPPEPTNLQEDWASHWKTTGSEQETPDDDDLPGPEQRYIKPISLCETLLQQLGCHPLPREDHALGAAIIHQLNPNGYFDCPLPELADALKTTPEHLEEILKLIQRFDPPGVAARDLRECLMLQLEREQADDTLAYEILDRHFDLFAQHRISALAGATRTSSKDVEIACRQIKQLNPKPGRAFSEDNPGTMVPDLVLHKREAHIDVELNDQDLPQLGLNRNYYRMLRDPATPTDAKDFLQQRFRQAIWVIKAIDERNTTLLAIGRCLISLQSEFIERGPQAIKPLTQAQVAKLIGRHPSTVSRAIAGKTIDTPFGIVRLEKLFASNVPQANANGHSAGVSDETIKSEIRRLVEEEPAERPLSDAVLARRLAECDISVARRTISKYRAHLKILPAHLRKRQK